MKLAKNITIYNSISPYIKLVNNMKIIENIKNYERSVKSQVSKTLQKLVSIADAKKYSTS